MKSIKIHTDGGCRGNQHKFNIGGIGIVTRAFLNNDMVGSTEYYQGFKNTTNNQMELQAAIKALELCETHISNGVGVELFTDSAYVVNGINQWVDGWIKRGWKKADKKPVENKELWQRLVDLSSGKNVLIIKTKGHANDEWNNRADALANIAMDKLEG